MVDDKSCLEFDADYCFSFIVDLPKMLRADMEDRPMGITTKLLAAVTSGYVHTGHWGMYELYKGPSSSIFYKENRWVIAINGVSIRDISFSRLIPLIIIRSSSTPRNTVPKQIYDTSLTWEARVVRNRGTSSQSYVWITIKSPVRPVKCVKQPINPFGNPIFPPPDLYIGSEPKSCADRGFERRVKGDVVHDWPFTKYKKRIRKDK